MRLAAIDILPAILILFPIAVLLKQYQITRSKDYLLFSLGFISIFFEILLDTAFNINEIPAIPNDDYSNATYLLLEKLRYLNFVIPATTFYFVGKRARYDSMIDRRSTIIIIWLISIMLLVLQMDLQTIPETRSIFFLTTHSTVSSGTIGVIYISDYLAIGQGYELMLILYQSGCVAYLLYAFLRLENTYKYQKFQRIVVLWSITLSLFILGNFFKVLLILDYTILNYNQIQNLQFISFILVALMSIFFAEGLLLSKFQISRILYLYSEAEKLNEEKSSGITSLFISKPLEYLRHVERQHRKNKLN